MLITILYEMVQQKFVQQSNVVKEKYSNDEKL